jgi:hypothetical protein
VGTSSQFPFFDGFVWLEARFELETGRSSCGGREPAKSKGNDDRIEAAEGEDVVVLEVAVPKGDLGLGLALWGFQMMTRGYDRILGIWRGQQPILVLEYSRQDLLVGMQCLAGLLYCQNLGISGLD